MLSLFSDDTKGLDKILSDNANYKNIITLNDFRELSLNSSSELTFAFFTYNNAGEMTDIVVSS